MKNLLLFSGKLSCLILVLIFAGCTGDIEIYKEYDDAGNLISEYQRRKSDFSKHGWFRVYDTEGQLIEEAYYQDNDLQGVRKLYFETGMLKIEEVYVDGFFEGPYKSYYPNAVIEMEGQYINNAMEGEWNFFYGNGQLKETVRFKGNEENGPFIEYHPNGNLKAEGTYKNGDYEDGELKLYDEAGELERIMNCNMGRCETTWKKEALSE